MGAFISVAKGSEEEPWFLEIKYNGGDEGNKPLALVGKGSYNQLKIIHYYIIIIISVQLMIPLGRNVLIVLK